MEEIGQILKTKGNQALVKIERHSLCSKCTNKCQLAAPESHELDEIEVEVDNPINAKNGQKVKIEMEEQALVIASLIIYIIPLICLILGYFIGLYFMGFIGANPSEGAGIIGSLLFLGLSFSLIKIIDRFLSKKKKYHPRIKEIIK